ncbi:MAG: glutamate racemase [Spirochaetes bacterium GWD1_27_9]|nr:MAG: glutamate racemase [Spirochaetes bacterium GWB1_27_13]OHD23046.1 MAG: glutamate racemase [Spirochaetes bacterium GWC1_27_15]OHD41362.1 MAG: glutamate racemase [Spirochaetes bacterium GWD1_27_9]
MSSYVLFIDSGIGGLSILDYFINMKKDVNVIYYADTKNFPYGTKDEETIGNFLLNIYIGLKEKYNISLIVVACNTASVSALEFLREKVKIKVIGTVPAVKVASDITRNNKIGVIATENTVKLNYLSNLIQQFAKNKQVFVKASGLLVEAAENQYSNEKLQEVMQKELSFFKEKEIDCLVLGCTHYSFLIDMIDEFFEKKVKVVDSRDGVSRRIIELLPSSAVNKNPKRFLYLSKGSDGIVEKYQGFNEMLKLFDEIIVKDLSCQKV